MDYFEIPGRRGSLRSAGVGNSIAGHRADGAIIDDPFGKREDADSPVMRQRVWEWYTSDLYTRLSADAWIVLTHTRWHRDDLAGRLLRKMAARSADQWKILCLPAVREEGRGDAADTRMPGEPLWPAFKSAADLEIIRRQDARAYAALYQQNPADASAAEWAPELFGDWVWVQPEHWPKKFDLRVVCLDASKGRSDKQGDYSAIVFLGRNAFGVSSAKWTAMHSSWKTTRRRASSFPRWTAPRCGRGGTCRRRPRTSLLQTTRCLTSC